MRRITLVVWAGAVAATALADGPPYAGKLLQEVLDEFRDDGLALVYSTQLVSTTLRVRGEPVSRQAVPVIEEILAPHGLTLDKVDGTYFVVRQTATPAAAIPIAHVDSSAVATPKLLELEEISVSASRYLLFSNSQFFIDQRAIQALPDLGEDPVRSAQRLPGTAAGGLSSRTHFRGGEHNETAIYLNGLELLDPFHIRDYHSIFSSIDARAISGVEAYTGGFPVVYGDQMSGVLVLETLKPDAPRHTELGLSVYNTSLLHSGYSSRGGADWLVSARSSNLDVILNDDLGEPDYADVFAELGVTLGGDHRLSVNALYADDQVVVITENDPEELEQSVSDTRSAHAWVSLESRWSGFLTSSTTLSWSSLDNNRSAEVNDPERLIARVVDSRDADIYGFRQDWRYAGFETHEVRLGLGFRREEASYAYRSSASYRGLFENWPNAGDPATSDVAAAPEGNSYSVYLSDRWRVADATRLELGLRWDRQTYTTPAFSGQLNPRVALLHRLGPATELRLTWGRYSQSQAIQELQVEDGLDRFFPPQRAEHWIAGLQRRFGSGHRLRAEFFYKDYERLKPRFENLFDPLALIPELAPDRVRLDPASARAAGFELTLEYRGSEDLDWWVSYSLSRATDRIESADEPRSWDQRHALQAAVAWRPGPWEIGAAVNIHTGWPTTSLSLGVTSPEQGGEPVYVPIPGPRNAQSLGAFAQIDFRFSRQIPVRRGRLSAFFEVTNATNRRNDCCIDYDIDEDEEGNVVLDRVVEHWLPLIPAIGLFWEF